MLKSLKCVIVDDDEIVRIGLKNHISKHDELEFINDFPDPISALKFINENEIDILFLDVDMPEMSGFEMLSNLKTAVHVIIISAEKENAAESYEYNVVDFLAKPIKYSRFLKSIEKVKNVESSFQPDSPNSKTVFLKDGTRLIKMDIDDITYIEALGDYLMVRTMDGKHTLLSTMKNIEHRLAPHNFVRTHRSYIVNLKYIKEIDRDAIYLGDKVIPVGRVYKEAVTSSFNLL